MAFTLTKQHGLPSAMPHIEYEPDPITDTNADDQLSTEPKKRGPEPEAQEDAEAYLRDVLANGPKPTKQIEVDAKDGYGISRRSLERARKKLGVESFRETVPGPWLLRLPNTASNTANTPKYKHPGDLGGLAETSGKNGDLHPRESNTATLFVQGGVGTNGHSVDDINAVLAQAGEGDGDPRLDDFLQGF